MKNKVIYAITLLSLLCVYSCRDDKSFFIDVREKNITDIPLTKFCKIDLETKKESLLYTVNNIIPYGSGYLIEGRERLLYFDDKGVFINQVGKRGRGPGEYVELSSAYVFQDTVHIYCKNKKHIIKFTLEEDFFAYRGYTAHPDTLFFSEIIRNDIYPDRYYTKNVYFGSGGVVPECSIYDDNFNLIANSDIRIKDGGLSWSVPFCSNECGIVFTAYADYSVISIGRNEIDESKSLDFGSFNVPDKYMDYTFDNIHEHHAYFADIANVEKQLQTAIFLHNDTLCIALRSGLVALYDLNNDNAKTYRLIDGNNDPVIYSAFSVYNGVLYISIAANKDNVDNPSIYKIKIDDL